MYQMPHLSASPLGHEHQDGFDDELKLSHDDLLEEGHGDMGEESSGEKDKGKTSRDGGDTGSVFFDEWDAFDQFDQVDFQGLPWVDFWKARKRNEPLRRRLTTEGEEYLAGFIGDDPELRSHVIEIALSDSYKYPTLLLDTGHVLQFQISSNGRLDRVRASSDVGVEGVRIAMRAFLSAGHSIHPDDVKFGRTLEFETRVKPIWTAEWGKMQAKPHYQDIPRRSKALRNVPVLN